MNSKTLTKTLDDVNNDLYNNLKMIRKSFYYIINKLVNEENIKNNTKNNINIQINNLENILQSINGNLIFFNENQDKISSISEKFCSDLFPIFEGNVNQNNKKVDIEVIIMGLSKKLKIFDKNFFYDEYILSSNIELENNINKRSKEVSKENAEIEIRKIHKKELENYIGQNNFKNISCEIKNDEKKENDVKIVNCFEFYLTNFIIKLFPSKPNNLKPITFDMQCKYISLHNTLLKEKINAELSSVFDLLTKKYIIKENNGINFVKSFVNYIHDLDKIFYIKCYGCKRNSKYSYIEKFFYPPYIKYNIEKYYNLKYPTNDKDILFFHPQCID